MAATEMEMNVRASADYRAIGWRAKKGSSGELARRIDMGEGTTSSGPSTCVRNALTAVVLSGLATSVEVEPNFARAGQRCSGGNFLPEPPSISTHDMVYATASTISTYPKTALPP